MRPDKEVKKEFREIASKHPEKYYAVAILKVEGYKRKKCTHCGKFFWSMTKSEFCGDPACSGGFRFIDKPIAKNKLDYIEVWRRFAEFFKRRGYVPIARYPVAARWRDDTDFVQASIYDFQPYVVSGEVSPPANPLVVPQFCLRFNDIDNVGITGAHYTGFVMIGQHAFMKPENWNQNKYFQDIHDWLIQGLGIAKEEVTYHEDAWAGGGNFGPCMEYFSRGLELGNQVYMLYEQTESGNKELKLKVLDMGMGHERNAWFCNGTSTSYDIVFPTVMKKLFNLTCLEIDSDLLKRFLPYSSYLNIDEVEDIDTVWNDIAQKLKTTPKELKEKIIPLSALYSIGEHSRSLLVALNDGVLPSNVAGGYNLRVILRRALSFIEQYKWSLDLGEICEWHAHYLKQMYPEIDENLEEVKKILEIERRKYEETKKKSRQIISAYLKKEISEDDLVQLYDSQGILPELIREEGKNAGKIIQIPEDFYSKVALRHEQTEQKTATRKEKFETIPENLPATKALYFDDYKMLKFSSEILAKGKDWIILKETAFYPTSGGQEHDTGFIEGIKVENVVKQGPWIIHYLFNAENFNIGQKVSCVIDEGRRNQLAQHHTATHLLNGVCKKILGKHIWQAGAAKTLEKGRLDITHYESLTKEEIEKIEKMVNEFIKKDIPVHSFFMKRDEAEKKYGFVLYQGGAVPGKELRIVEIEGLDVEACGGTHLNSTGEIGELKILKTSKIQDGIIRLEYVAGGAAKKSKVAEEELIKELSGLLKCQPNQIPYRAEELFEKWKDVVKKGRKIESIELFSEKEFSGNIIEKTGEILKTQPEYLARTIKRFQKELEEKI
jgi:alanyl-tRNA synthetase